MSGRAVALLFIMVLSTEAFAADEVHWTVTGPTSVAFDWRGTEDIIYYWIDGPRPPAPDSVTATAPQPLPFSSAGPFWEAEITGLQENTRYRYSIGDGPEHTFRTPPSRGNSRFTVYAEGDIGSTNTYSRVGGVQDLIAKGVQDLIAKDEPAFVLPVGDLTYGNDKGMDDVDQHFNDVMVWSRDAAYMPAWGNHEWSSPDDLRNYKGRFDLPNSQTSPGSPSVSCCREDWYWFDYGNARFIAYPEPWSGAWADWKNKAAGLMGQAQADPNIDFIVTFGHRPAYSSGTYAGSSTLKGILDTFGDTYSKYVLNLNGHSHDYERSFPQHGVVHATVGTGGSSVPTKWRESVQPSWSAFRALHHGAFRLTFTGTGPDAKIDGAFFCGPAQSGNDINCGVGDVIDNFTVGAGGGGDTTPPSIPTGLTAMATSSSRIDLAWSASTDNVGVAGYEIHRDGNPIPIATTSVASYADTGLSSCTTYTYTVVAYDAAGNTSNPSSPASAQTPPCAGVQVRVAGNADDAEESASGSVSLTSSDLELTYDGSNQTIGMRFAALNIPPAATINKAYVQFQVDEPNSEATSLTIQGQAIDNAPTFTTAKTNISGRSRTAAAVPWTPPAWTVIGAAGPDQRTSDIRAVVQEIVSRPSWSAGNALAIIVIGTGHRTAEAYNGVPTAAPLLHVEYQ
jgi:chitodextrinase